MSLSPRGYAVLALVSGLSLAFLLTIRAQQPAPEERARESISPPASRYYEARITPEGYALYIPFFVPRGADAATTDSVGWADPARDVRTREEVVEGEYIQAYRPAVYEIDETGRERLLEPEGYVTLPKVRVVLEPWFRAREGTREGAEPNAGERVNPG